MRFSQRHPVRSPARSPERRELFSINKRHETAFDRSHRRARLESSRGNRKFLKPSNVGRPSNEPCVTKVQPRNLIQIFGLRTPGRPRHCVPLNWVVTRVHNESSRVSIPVTRSVALRIHQTLSGLFRLQLADTSVPFPGVLRWSLFSPRDELARLLEQFWRHYSFPVKELILTDINDYYPYYEEPQKDNPLNQPLCGASRADSRRREKTRPDNQRLRAAGRDGSH